MLAIANYGIIYVEGRAGTLQEIFQDAAQNYYNTFKYPSPMIFYKKTQWINTLPVKPLLDELFKKTPETTKKLLVYVDSPQEVYDAIERFQPPYLDKISALR